MGCVIILAVCVSVSAFGFVDLVKFFLTIPLNVTVRSRGLLWPQVAGPRCKRKRKQPRGQCGSEGGMERLPSLECACARLCAGSRARGYLSFAPSQCLLLRRAHLIVCFPVLVTSHVLNFRITTPAMELIAQGCGGVKTIACLAIVRCPQIQSDPEVITIFLFCLPTLGK